MREIMENNQKSAFIAIVGRPNVGKSTILNKLIGEKVSIVSNKPQTTRNRIMGILTEGPVQLVFIDTPGLIKPKNSLGEYMVKSVTESVAGVEACLLVAEADKPVSEADRELIKKFSGLQIPAVLAINKIDLLKDKPKLMEQISEYSSLFGFSAVVPVSAKQNDGMDDLKKELMSLATDGEHMFEDDMITDQSERVMVQEIVREKILRSLRQEVPHGIAVVTERMQEKKDLIDIEATIYTEKESHKGIIIGKGGTMLKKIGTEAREDMERFFDCHVNIKLWVKVKENWRDRPEVLQDMGYDSNDFS
jgi:GTP-binding protein Era